MNINTKEELLQWCVENIKEWCSDKDYYTHVRCDTTGVFYTDGKCWDSVEGWWSTDYGHYEWLTRRLTGGAAPLSITKEEYETAKEKLMNALHGKTEITQDDLIAGLHVVEFEGYSGKQKALFLQKGCFIYISEDVTFNDLWRSSVDNITRVWEHKPSDDRQFRFKDSEYMTLVWEKSTPAPAVEEMTMAEVCKALGKTVKIVE